MDRVFRLIFFLSLFASHLVASAAGVWVKISDPMWGSSSSPYPSALAYCNAWRANFNGLYTEPTITYAPRNSEGAQRATCKFRYADTNGDATQVTVDEFCPSGAWVNGAGCYQQQVSCPNGQVEQDGVCGDAGPQCPAAGTVEGDGSNSVVSGGSSPTDSVCIGGCGWRGGGAVPSGCLNGKCFTFGPFTSTGESCTGVDAPSDSNDADANCAAKGQCSGTINGTTVCVACTSTESTKSTTVETDTGSGGQGTSTSKTTSTKCDGATCTSTETTTTTGGDGTTSTSTTTTTQPKQDYCQSNPTALECKADDDESSWGGTCESQFTCDGDAVQCAQAQAAWQAACALKTDRTNTSVLAGQAAIDGTDKADVEAGLGKGESTPFALSSMIGDAPVFGGAGGCPGDASVSVAGVGVTIPFSSLCPMFLQIGVAMRGFAYLIAAFIVFRRGR